MKPSNHLHSLVQSLSTVEKNYIKKYAGVYSKSKYNYYKLLEAIYKQEVYDEKALLIKLRKEPFIKHFAVTKNQLLELILKLLRQFHQKNSFHATINAILEDARLLYNRGIHDLAFKKLDKASLLAEEYLDYTKIGEIIDLKRHFIDHLKGHDWRKEIDALLVEKEYLLASDLECIAYARSYYKLLFLARKYNQLRNKGQQQELKDITPSLQLSPPKYTKHIYSQLFYLNIRCIYHYLRKEFERSTKYMKQAIELWDEYPKVIEKDIEEYILALNKHMNLGIVNTDTSVFEYSFSKLKAIPQNSTRTQTIVFVNEALWRINYCQVRKQYDELLEFIPKVEQALDNLQNRINPSRYLALVRGVALVYFIVEDYDKTLKYLNIILDFKQTCLSRDIAFIAQMMVLFTHYNMGNLIFLDNALKNYRRKLQKKDLLYEFENLQIKALLSLCSAKDKTGTIKYLDKLEQDSKSLFDKKPALNTSLFGYFNLYAWIKATKLNCSMKEVLEHDPTSWETLKAYKRKQDNISNDETQS